MQSIFLKTYPLKQQAVETWMKSKVTPEDVFLGSEPPLPSGFSQPLTPTFREISQHAFCHGGVDFFGIAQSAFLVIGKGYGTLLSSAQAVAVQLALFLQQLFAYYLDVE